MPEVTIPAGETKQLITRDQADEQYIIHVQDDTVRLGHQERYAREGQEFDPGDRGRITRLKGKPLYGYASGTSAVTVRLDSANFTVDLDPRSDILNVDSIDGIDTIQEVTDLRNVLSTVSVQEDTPLDVSAATVSMQEATPLDVSAATVSMQEATPLDVSAATVNVQEATPLDVSAATVGVQEATPLDVSAATVGVQEATPLDVSAATVSVQEDLPLDVSGATVTTDPTSDINRSIGTVREEAAEAYENGTSLASGGSISNSLSTVAADSLSGIVTRATTSYDVSVEWTDSAGNVIQTETVASGVTGGNQTTWDLPARAPQCNVIVADAGSGSGAVDLTAHLR